MKKILLSAVAFAFSFALMAQNETKSQGQVETRKQLEAKKLIKDQTVPVKTATAEVKPQVVEAQNQTSPDNVIKMNVEKYDFGKIKQGVPVTYAFEIKNISKTPVVVANTSASCGCTTPEKIVEPIAPGATAKLKVQYSAAAVGTFTKDVHITLAGIAQPKTVQITGEVVAPEPPKEVKSNN
jgi:hypothetical protein